MPCLWAGRCEDDRESSMSALQTRLMRRNTHGVLPVGGEGKIGVRYASGDGFGNGKELPWSIAPAASLLSSKPVWPSWHIKEKNTKSNLFHHIFLRKRTSWQKTIGQAYAEVLTHANSRHSFRPAIGSPLEGQHEGILPLWFSRPTIG